MSDLPSNYTKDIELFRQVRNIPDPRDSMPVPSASVWSFKKVGQQQAPLPCSQLVLL